MSRRDRPRADGRPDPAHNWLQSDPVFVGGESFDGDARMGLRLFGDDLGDFFLNASYSTSPPLSDCAGVASGSTNQSLSTPPNRVAARASPTPIRQPSSARPCRWSSAGRRAAARRAALAAAPTPPASKPSPCCRCLFVDRQAPSGRRRCNVQDAARSNAVQTR